MASPATTGHARSNKTDEEPERSVPSRRSDVGTPKGLTGPRCYQEQGRLASYGSKAAEFDERGLRIGHSGACWKSAVGVTRCEVWLAALDDFRNWLIREAA